MSTFITKSFLDHSTSKNCQNFLPAAGIYWLIKLPVLLLTPIVRDELVDILDPLALFEQNVFSTGYVTLIPEEPN